MMELETREVAKLVKQDEVRPTRPRVRQVLNELIQLASVLQLLRVERPGEWLQLPLTLYGGLNPAELIRDGRGQEIIEDLVAHAMQ